MHQQVFRQKRILPSVPSEASVNVKGDTQANLMIVFKFSKNIHIYLSVNRKISPLHFSCQSVYLSACVQCEHINQISLA